MCDDMLALIVHLLILVKYCIDIQCTQVRIMCIWMTVSYIFCRLSHAPVGSTSASSPSRVGTILTHGTFSLVIVLITSCLNGDGSA